MNLRQAAEQALKYFEDAYGLEDTEVAIKEALRQALSQPEYQYEVVAVSENGIRTVKQTTTPKREWVGLTDEEIYDYADKFLYQHGSNYGIRSFGKAIEAKLREKNHD
jgi:hypothetical protein